MSVIDPIILCKSCRAAISGETGIGFETKMVYSCCQGLRNKAFHGWDDLDQLYMAIRNGRINIEDTVASGIVATRQECCSKECHASRVQPKFG